MRNKKGKTMNDMIKYIRCHIVEAKPMTRGEFKKYRGPLQANENPDEEGYLVKYPDGYESWCPKAAFEAAGRPIDGMTFGMAIEAMKKGKKVARGVWSEKGMKIWMETGRNIGSAEGQQEEISCCIVKEPTKDEELAKWSASRLICCRMTGASSSKGKS